MLFSFYGGDSGEWRVIQQLSVIGAPLDLISFLHMRAGEHGEHEVPAHRWVLRGFTSNVRYATRQEVDTLRSRQEGLGRAKADRAALIPIRKNAAWWAMAQDERRAIFEEISHHTAIGLDALPAIARQLHHSRDLGEPFDFLTWFEYAAEDEPVFNKLVDRLRGTKEWDYIEREVDIRLERQSL